MTHLRRPLGNVLVAVDLSQASAAVIERAAQLPITPGSSVTMLHVLPEGFPSPSALEEVTTADAHRLLADAVARFSALTKVDVSVNPVVAHGTPFVEIIRRARDERAELVVIGRHGQRGFGGALLGSTAERVFRKSDLATLIVGAAPQGPYRRPMVAVDLSDTSRRALELALRVIDAQTGTVDVVHSWDVRAGGDPEERDGSALARFLASFEGGGLEWRVNSCPGDARTVILDQALQRGVDLLVLGARGRSKLTQLLIGSVAEAVARAASCDVLVARAPKRVFELP